MTDDLLMVITGKELYIGEFVDPETLFHVVSKDGTTAEKRLLICICAIEGGYSQGELRRISCINYRRTRWTLSQI